MKRFFTSTFKVPESPYTPAMFSPEDSTQLSKLADPSTVNAGRPTVLSLSPDKWKDPKKSYLVQGQKDGDQPFASTYERVAGGTSHWLGTSLRFCANDFKMKSSYGQFVDWPIGYNDLDRWYGQAERELGVSADVRDQAGLGIPYAAGYAYPMPRIPPSLVDAVRRRCAGKVLRAERAGLGMDDAEKADSRSSALPAARNSQPYGIAAPAPATPTAFRSARSRPSTIPPLRSTKRSIAET